jgi:hypothetical protein
MPGVTRAEYEERLQFLEAALMEGMNTTAIIREVAKRFGVSEAQGWRDYRALRRRWAAAPKTKKEERERRIRLHLAELRRNDLYRRALQGQDVRTALRIQDNLDKLFGLFPQPEPKRKAKSSEPAGETKMITFVDHLETREDERQKSPIDALPAQTGELASQVG